MSSILPLGNIFNVGRNASGGSNRFAMRDYSGVVIVVDTPANSSQLTLTECTASSGGSTQALGGGVAAPAGGFGLWTQTNGVWTAVPIVAGGNYTISTGVIVLSGTPDLAAVWVNQGALSDTYAYLLASHSAKALTYIAAAEDVGRKPTNLRSLYA